MTGQVNPVGVLDLIDRGAHNLDLITKALNDASDNLDAAESAWDACLDAITASLEEEFNEAGRKSVPEHTALSAARRAHRAEYVAYRTAKRRVERLSLQLKSTVAATSARQTLARGIGDEAGMPARRDPVFERRAA